MDDENKKQDLSNISIEEEEMTNPYLRSHRLTTVVNKAYIIKGGGCNENIC